MDQYTDVLTGLITNSFEDDQIYLSGSHTDEQYVIQVNIYGTTHQYLTGKISRDDFLDWIRLKFLTEANIPYEHSIYINDFYIDKTDVELKTGHTVVFHTITFHISVDRTDWER